VLLTVLAMLAFAGNSLLCRAALAEGAIDAGRFTALRLLSGAVVLGLITRAGPFPARRGGGNWPSALALLLYAAGFSWAYVSLPAATGALLLFAAVQATMIGVGVARGERLGWAQVGGIILAGGGVLGLLLPGASAPAPVGAVLMVVAGVAWGVYSLRGRGAGDATRVTAGNFVRAALLALPLAFIATGDVALRAEGVLYAVASGALASGLGYAVWYTALPALRASTAATVQLSVPAIAALGAVLLLGEPLTLRLVVASVTILGGILLVLRGGAAVAAPR
jgi:drug/metabolite transporter (DMT)-like permease